MESKELKRELEKALETIKNCWSNNDQIDYQLELIEKEVMNLISKIA